MDLEVSIAFSDLITNSIMKADNMTCPLLGYSLGNEMHTINHLEKHIQEHKSKIGCKDVNSNLASPKFTEQGFCEKRLSENKAFDQGLRGDVKFLVNNKETCTLLLQSSKENGNFEAPVVEELASNNSPAHTIGRSNSCGSPVITSIKIGTPVRKELRKNEVTTPNISEDIEYTISVTNQNELKVHMTTSPIVQNCGCDSNSCSSTSSPVKEMLANGSKVEYMGDAKLPAPQIQVGDQIVKLRPKKNADNNYSTATSYLSKTDEMKRHSAEISQLRQSLEQKIAGYHNNNKNKSNEKKRPSSSLGFSDVFDSPCKDVFKHHDSCSRVRKSLSYTSSPVHWQSHVRSSFQSADPKKLRFLLENHQRSRDQCASNLYNEYKTVLGSTNERISYPQNYRNNHCMHGRNNSTYCPYIDERCTSPIFEYEDNSLYSTPFGSPEPTSLRHPRTKRNCNHSSNTPQGPVTESDGRVNYYPNCDATIWLRSCQKEVREPLSGVKSGEVPLWLSGTLIRNGPGRLQVGNHKYNHLFDGSALLHRFHFHKGRVTYQNKFLRSNSYLRDTKAQRIVVNYFGTRAHPDPCRTILQNIASKFDFEEHFTDNAQISLYPYGDGLYALTETPFIFRVDPETLDTHEKVDLTKYLAVLTHTAHPHVDKDGTVYNIGQGVGPIGPRYYICKFPNPKADKKGTMKTPFDQAQIVGSVNARWRLNPCYMHSFAMTENYFIIIEQPLVVSVAKMIKVVLKQDALIDALQWWERETKIHVVRRDNGCPVSTQYVTETFFFLHTINAYEEKGHIILDIATYKNAEMLHCMYVEALKNASYDPTYAQMFRGRPKRWVIPLHPNKDASIGTNLVTLSDTKCQGRWLKKNLIYLTPELLADIGCEVPRIHYDKYNGRPYQYFYAICSDVDHPNPGTLVKVDVVNKTHVEWSEDNVYPSEPIFVPHPQAKKEDEGVVLSALLRAKGLDTQVCLLILDAATFTELGRVEFVTPGPVPKCLHGWFVHEGAFKIGKKDEVEQVGTEE
ncbi:Beta,beta-carotene 9',10'-oxygenase [Halocaridina rubra]|uniref:Beta,beta-carotene 9',10'-oxygenase n=1 Tax=Halocaridina rubra TaxID=373956 RepID=A0AAN8WT80_HALRR